MQHLNNDMDDLFRKAAENYPLRTGAPDWEKVAAGLKEEEKERPVVLPFYRRYLLLITVGTILVVGGGLYSIFSTSISLSNNDTAPIAHTRTDTNRLNKGATPEARLSQNVPVIGVEVDSVSTQNSVANETDKELMYSASPVSASKNKSLVKQPGHGTASAYAGSEAKNGNGSLSQNNRPRLGTNNIIAPSDPQDQDITPLTTISAEDEQARLQAPAPYTSMPDLNKFEPGNIVAPPAEGRHFATAPVKIRKPLPDTRFYAGFAGGIDFTSVSLQRISNPGFHYGVMAGYRFSNRLSIEAGLFIEKKDYYTDAEHFDKSRLYINPNSKILSIDGVCYMYEIPVAIKYDISNTYRSGWFVTGGLSSYIMKKEDYSMLYYYNTSNTTAKHDYTYRNSGSAFFSQLRITGGYIYKLPSGFSLRAEPYLNIPVREAGYGKLRLVSGGVNVGIFKKLF